jgi:hypothetical protein
MRLTRFRVTNFRSVNDSEWIDMERVTSLIGVNESGKTNLLLPLWKLNPAREGEIRPTSDYPKDNYAAVRAAPGNFEFITAEFDVSDLADKLAAMTGVDRQFLDMVHVTRDFSGEYSISFPKHEPAQFASHDDLEKQIAPAISEIETLTPLAKESTLKSDLLSALKAAGQIIAGGEKHSAEDIKRLADTLTAEVPESPAPTSSIVPPCAAKWPTERNPAKGAEARVAPLSHEWGGRPRWRLRNGIGVFEVARHMGTSVQMMGSKQHSAVFATRLGLEPGMLYADIAVLGILAPSFDTQCRPPRYSARRHCAFLRQPLPK